MHLQKIDQLLQSLLLKQQQLESLKRENTILTENVRRLTEEKCELMKRLAKQTKQIESVQDLEKKIEKYEFILQIEKYRDL